MKRIILTLTFIISFLTIAYSQTSYNKLNIQLYPIQILEIGKPTVITFSDNINERKHINIYSTSGYDINIYNNESTNKKTNDDTSNANTKNSNNIPTQLIYSIEVI